MIKLEIFPDRMIKAYAAFEVGEKLRPFEHDPAILNDHNAEIAIEYCGICHSNLSCLVPMCAGMTRCPFVPSHQIVGTISAKGNIFS